MYKLLLVDDRVDVVNAISEMGHWEDMNVKVCGTAVNGLDALGIIEDEKPDIVITDVKMPIMDGLELTRQAKELDSEIHIILLSGYDDFRYAQQAVKLGAQEYLLKPADIDELRGAVKRSCKLIEEERKKYYDRLELEKKLVSSMPLMRAEYLSGLIKKNDFKAEAIKERFLYLGIELDTEGFCVLLFAPEYDDDTNADEILVYGIINIIEEITNEYAKSCVFKCEKNRICAIVNQTEERLGIYDMARRCQELIARHLNIGLSVGMGEYFKNITDIFRAYETADAALENRFVLGRNSIIDFDTMETEISGLSEYPYKEEEELISYALAGAQPMVQVKLTEYFDKLDGMGSLSAEDLHTGMICFALEILRKLRFAGIDADKLTDKNADYIKLINSAETYDEIKNTVRDILFGAAKYMYDKKMTEAEDVQQKVIDYIDEHYTDPDISLTQIAKHFYISTSYLSVIIKKTCNEGFSKRLVRMRIDRAKILLLQNTDEKIYNVAEQVGFKDRRYFSDTFKKYTGYTPKDYIEQYGKASIQAPQDK